MYKLEKFTKFLLYIYLSYIFRKKKVYTVVGMRRSGNHAFINWFLSAIENKKVDFIEVETVNGNISLSSTNNTLFINEANYHGVISFLKVISEVKGYIDTVEFVIISLEDYIPEKYSPYIPHGARKIAITRSILNIIASRLRRAQNQAKIGLDRGDMRIDISFINGIIWILNSPNNGWVMWSYDSWMINDSQYKEEFLNRFQLSFNFNPAISTQGGGSSFSLDRGIPNYNDATTRWTKIKLPHRIAELLLNYSDEINLREDEKKILQTLLKEEASI